MGFEPTRACTLPLFESGTFDHSDISPRRSIAYLSGYGKHNITNFAVLLKDTFGIVIKHDPDAHEGPGGRELTGLQLMDIAPTILEQFGIPVPADMQGKVQ